MLVVVCVCDMLQYAWDLFSAGSVPMPARSSMMRAVTTVLRWVEPRSRLITVTGVVVMVVLLVLGIALPATGVAPTSDCYTVVALAMMTSMTMVTMKIEAKRNVKLAMMVRVVVVVVMVEMTMTVKVAPS